MAGDPRVLPFEPQSKGEATEGYVCMVCGMSNFADAWEFVEHLAAHEEADA